MNTDLHENFFSDYYDFFSEKKDIEKTNEIYCDCNKIIEPGASCYECGQCNFIQLNNQLTFEQKLTVFYKNIKYSRRRYMFIYLIILKRAGEKIYCDEEYENLSKQWLTRKYEQDIIYNSVDITFRTFFFRLKRYKHSELSNFILYCSGTINNKIKLIEKIKNVLTYEMINRIAREYNNKKKWPNRNMFLYYYFREVYDIIEPIIFTTNEIKERYSSKL